MIANIWVLILTWPVIHIASRNKDSAKTKVGVGGVGEEGTFVFRGEGFKFDWTDYWVC